MEYRRAWVPGGTFFFTVNLENRQSHLLIEHVSALTSAFHYTKQRHPFRLNALVVMPNHFHAVMTLPKDEADFSTRLRLIKTHFSRNVPRQEVISPSRKDQCERGIWQRLFWEHVIRDEIDYINHIHYVHFNPVKHGYVIDPHLWPYSTIHRNR